MIRLPMIRLTDPAHLRSVLPQGRDPAAWHAALTDEIARHLSPAHAQLLARPERIAGGLAWNAEGAARARYAELPATARQSLDAALTAILSDIRRLAESGLAPAVREAWPALREIPDMGHLFAVDGRPVLAAWGHTIGVTARLARFDDGVPWRAVPLPPWRRYAAMAAILALLGLAAGLALPFAGPWLTPKPASCAIDPGQLQAMRDQAALDSRGAELRTLLATLTDETGRQQLLCPIAVTPPPTPVPTPQPAPPPAPPPPSPPRADLPRDRWDRKDLTLLEGCWHLESSITVSNDDLTRHSRVRSWLQCFDGHGSGHQTMVLEDGRRCEGPLGAAFADNGLLRVTELQQCRGPGLTMTPSLRVCARTSDTEAICDGRNLAGARAGSLYSGRFRR